MEKNDNIDMKKALSRVGYLYSFYYGLMPVKFGMPGIIKLDEGELDIKKCLDKRIMEQPDFYPQNISNFFMNRILNENDYESTDAFVPDEEYYNIVENFVKQQVKKFQTQKVNDGKIEFEYVMPEDENYEDTLTKKDFYDILWLKTNDYMSEYIKLSMHYRDIMVDLDKTLSDVNNAYSVDTFAFVAENLLKEQYNTFIKDQLRREGSTGKTLLDNVFCGLKEMHDPETNKDYWVLCFLGNLTENYNNMFTYDSKEQKEKTNEKLLELIKNNHPYVFVLGEKGGYINPFSKLPTGYKGKTMITNFNALSPKIENTPLYIALLRPLKTAREICLNNANINFMDLYNDYASFNSHADGFDILDKAIYGMFEDEKSTKKIKKIANIIQPKGISKLSSIVRVDKKERLRNYLNSLEKENKKSFDKIRYKDQQIMEKKAESKMFAFNKIVRHQSDPFPEFNKK